MNEEIMDELDQAIKMDIHLEFRGHEGWLADFRQASPAMKSIMFSAMLDAFNDGCEDVMLSFSEPEVKS